MRSTLNSNKKSQLEKLHAEADALLSQKAEEIVQLNKVIEEAEQKLILIQAQLAKQMKENENIKNENENMIDRELLAQQIQDLQARHDAELQSLQSQHESRLKEMNDTFQKSVQSAELWAQTHADSIAADKASKLLEMQKSLETLQSSTNENLISISKNRQTNIHQSKKASYLNQQRIKVLENQISEITAITREEARDIKTKIEECLTTIELRGKEHENEISRYQREIEEREAKYADHIQNMLEQYAIENKRMESAIQCANSQAESLPKLLKQMEKQNDSHYQTSMKDLEKVKSALYQTQTREEKEQVETRNSVTQVQLIQKNQRKIQQEIDQLEIEINELNTENEQLRIELMRLDKSVYR